MSNTHQGRQARAQAAAYHSDPAMRQSTVRDLFNQSAQYYDQVNLLFSLGSGAWYRRFCLRRAGVRPGTRIIDIAIGTGLVAREAVALTGDPSAVTGIDVSEAMLAIARKNLGIALIQGTAEALPLAPAIADFVTMGYAMRHVADLELALREALRVLRPGGRIILLEVGAPRFRMNRWMASAYIGGILPALSFLWTRKTGARALMRYHWETIANYMPREAIMRVMTESGFSGVKCQSYFDLFQHYSGDRPMDSA